MVGLLGLVYEKRANFSNLVISWSWGLVKGKRVELGGFREEQSPRPSGAETSL
jgi:hypothetical protein